jgi:2-amino-4-hydroxy-6-hydroxymethyldihydropteridine diphosphokinase
MKALVALGSNLGDRLTMLQRACVALDAEAGIELGRVSSVYKTDPIGPGEQAAYLNAVVELETALEPRSLLERLLAIELALGRDRSAAAVHWGPRTLDLDLLLMGDLQVDEDGLELPHPRLHERAFVLLPLLDVAADAVHPGLGRTVAELATEVAGSAGIERQTGMWLLERPR